MGEERTYGRCLPLPDDSIEPEKQSTGMGDPSPLPLLQAISSGSNGEEETCGSCLHSSLDGYTELKKQNTPDTGDPPPRSQLISLSPKGSVGSLASSESTGEVHHREEQIHVGRAITDVVLSPSTSGFLRQMNSPSVNEWDINSGQYHNKTQPSPPRIHQEPGATQPWAKVVMVIISTLVVGLLGINYTINRNDNLMPANLFSTRPASFGFFLVVVSVTFYVAMMAMIIRLVMPRVAKVLNIVAFACVVLGVTVLLWALFPRSFSCVPWIFFGATIFILLGVILYEWVEHGKRVKATSVVPRPTFGLQCGS